MVRLLSRSLAAFALVALLITSSFADNVYGKIRGTVSDQNGGVVSGATVQVTEQQTGVSQAVTTKGDGSYEFQQLPIGVYTISASAPSFKQFKAVNISLNLNQVFVQNVTLTVGAVAEVVNVEAAPVQVDSTNIQLSTTISNKTIEDLPLLGRNWINLQQLQPGVVANTDRFATTFATNGSQAQQNSYLLNGLDSNDLPLNAPLVIPSPDAIAEFTQVQSSLNPEFGRNSGAILNAAIKSGTNSFHGDAFEFYRDTFLNTKPYFGKSPQVFHQNLFGGTIGGPIRKDHTFFFYSYQGTRARQNEPVQSPNVSTDATVLSLNERNGIITGINAGTDCTKIGCSPFPLVGENGTTFPAGTPYQTIFPTGHIPAADFNPISNTLLTKFIPPPNSGTTDFLFNPVRTQPVDQHLFKLDHTFNAKDSIWFYGLFQHSSYQETLAFFGASVPGFPDMQDSHVKQFDASYNHVFDSNTLNEFRLGYTRLNFNTVAPVSPVLPSSLGFQINPQSTVSAGVPQVAISGGPTLGFSNNGPQPRIDGTSQATDNFSKIIGRHSLKMGIEVRHFQVSNPFFFNNNGVYTFGGSGPFSTGSSVADFLLGIPDNYAQSSGGDVNAGAYEFYQYFQDQWKVRDNLTVTYGVGYQIDTPLDQNANGGLFNDCFISGQQSTVFPTAPVGLLFAGDKGCSKSGYSTKYDHVGPRVGFAYSPDLGWLSGGPGKTSIRAGYGIYFNRSEEELALSNLQEPPFSLASAGINDQFAASPSFANPFATVNNTTVTSGGARLTAGSIANKYPFIPAPRGSAVDFTFFESMFVNTIDPKFSAPYSENMNFTIERQLPSAMILRFGYVGALGRHETVSYDINLPNAAACLAEAGCPGARFSQNTSFPQNFPLIPGNIIGGLGQTGTRGSSNYNSFQAQLTKAATHGLSFEASYTWSHSLDNGSSFESSRGSGSQGQGSPVFLASNPSLNYGDSDFDARQRFVVNYAYDIPRWRMGEHLRFLDRVVNGFRITGLTTLQTGFPISFVANTDFNSLGCGPYSFFGCPDRPNFNGTFQTLDPRATNTFNSRTGSFWFVPAGFSKEAIGTIGNARRNMFHGPGLNNTDLALEKDFKVDERRYFELRLEAYNAFNHTQFNNPSGDVDSRNFGRITSAQSPRLVQLGAKFYF
jgi:hypothetical protein